MKKLIYLCLIGIGFLLVSSCGDTSSPSFSPNSFGDSTSLKSTNSSVSYTYKPTYKEILTEILTKMEQKGLKNSPISAFCEADSKNYKIETASPEIVRYLEEEVENFVNRLSTNVSIDHKQKTIIKGSYSQVVTVEKIVTVPKKLSKSDSLAIYNAIDKTKKATKSTKPTEKKKSK